MKKQISVWIVEDEENTAHAYYSILGQDYTVRTFTSAQLAIEEVKKGHQPNVMITDLRMPGMNGFLFMKQLRELGITVPTIVVSGYIDPRDLKIMMNHHVFSYLEKPFSFVDLKAQINDAAQWYKIAV